MYDQVVRWHWGSRNESLQVAADTSFILNRWTWRGRIEEPTILQRHQSLVTHLAWSTDGRILASASQDGEIELLPVELVHPCDWVTRNMHDFEWRELRGKFTMYEP